MTRTLFAPVAALFLAFACFVPSAAYATLCYTDADCQGVGGSCTGAIDSTSGLHTCSITQTTGTPGTQTQTTGVSGGSTGGLLNPLGTGTDLNALIVAILSFVVRIGAIVVVFMLVYVGFLFVTARGEPGAITKARQALLWTVVGALILLGAQAIALAIQSTVTAISNGG